MAFSDKIRFSQDDESIKILRKFEADFKKRTGRKFPSSNLEWEKLLADCGLTPAEVREIRSKLASESEVAEYYANGALLDLIYAKLGTDNQLPKITCNAAMMDKLMKKPESRGWTAKQWSEAIEFSEGTIKGCSVWKGLMTERAGLRMTRNDRPKRR